jgi:predicted permease
MDALTTLRQSLRSLRADRGFAVAAIAILALGLGANTAVFTVVDSILFRPLQYREPDRLYSIEEIVPQFVKIAPVLPVNGRHYTEWRAQAKSFEEIALVQTQNYNLTGSGEPEKLNGVRVTPNFFSTLGVAPQRGRDFSSEESRPGRDAVVLLSDSLWRRRFGAREDLIGQTIVLNDIPHLVAGVLPPEFRQHSEAVLGARSAAQPDVFQVWALQLEHVGWAGEYNYAAVGRLKLGVTPQQALAELNVIQAQIKTHFEAGVGNMDLLASLTPLKDEVVDRGRAGLLLLLGAVGAVLLIACVNLGNLMLVRASRRGRETAIRSALGAGRWQVIQGVLAECIILALTGAALGVALSYALLKSFTAWAPASLPRADEVSMNPLALLFAFGLAMLTAFLFGFIPAWRLANEDPQDALRSGGRGQTDAGRKMRLREILVSVEAALSVALLIVAGLLGVSFLNIGAVDRGYVSSNLLTANVNLPEARYKTPESRRHFYNDLLSRLKTQRGVQAAGVVSVLPLGGQAWADVVTAEGDSRPIAEKPILQYRVVSPGYFKAMGIPIELGRSIDDHDYPRKPALMSRRAAEKIWPGANPIGKTFRRGDPKEAPFEIVGVTGDIRSTSLEKDPDPIVYVALWERTPLTGSIAIRTTNDPASATAFLRESVRAIDRQAPVSNVETMVQIENTTEAERRFETQLALAFAASALLLALVGTYSVLATSVASRANEIGIRMALGARAPRVVKLILFEGLRPVAIGIGLGIGGAWFASRLIGSMLYSVSATDPRVFAAVGLATLLSASLACLIPARRAASVSPLEALRHD